MSRLAAALAFAAAALSGTGVLGDDGVAEVFSGPFDAEAANGASDGPMPLHEAAEPEDAAVHEVDGAPELAALSVSSGNACAGQNWRTDFSNRMYQCGIRTGGSAHSAGQCMAQTQHVSAACGQCLGNLISCGAHNCMHDCCAGNCRTKTACADCNAKHCNWAFQQCSGSWPPRRLHEDASEDAFHV